MRLLLIPFGVMVIVQIGKLVFELLRGNFSWEHLNEYGGMPSAHSALAASLVTLLYLDQGMGDAALAVAFVLFIVIIRDASGFRRQLGVHAQMINRLIKELPEAEEYKYPVLNERLGHTPAQVIVGTVAGIILTYLVIYLLPYF
ncbi:MAG: divergent PAP2 family protein [Candidatus Komeilibacteria bacterium]